MRADLADAQEPVKILSVAADPLPKLTQDENINYDNGVWEMELATYTAGMTAIKDLTVTCEEVPEGASKKEIAALLGKIDELTEKMNAEPIILLDDDKSRGAGTYTLKESLSNFRKINIIACATTLGANTTSFEVPVCAFKNLPTDSPGFLFTILGSNQFIYVQYVNDTTITIDSHSASFLRTIYGIK